MVFYMDWIIFERLGRSPFVSNPLPHTHAAAFSKIACGRKRARRGACWRGLAWSRSPRWVTSTPRCTSTAFPPTTLWWPSRRILRRCPSTGPCVVRHASKWGGASWSPAHAVSVISCCPCADPVGRCKVVARACRACHLFLCCRAFHRSRFLCLQGSGGAAAQDGGRHDRRHPIRRSVRHPQDWRVGGLAWSGCAGACL